MVPQALDGSRAAEEQKALVKSLLLAGRIDLASRHLDSVVKRGGVEDSFAAFVVETYLSANLGTAALRVRQWTSAHPSRLTVSLADSGFALGWIGERVCVACATRARSAFAW